MNLPDQQQPDITPIEQGDLMLEPAATQNRHIGRGRRLLVAGTMLLAACTDSVHDEDSHLIKGVDTPTETSGAQEAEVTSATISPELKFKADFDLLRDSNIWSYYADPDEVREKSNEFRNIFATSELSDAATISLDIKLAGYLGEKTRDIEDKREHADLVESITDPQLKSLVAKKNDTYIAWVGSNIDHVSYEFERNDREDIDEALETIDNISDSQTKRLAQDLFNAEIVHGFLESTRFDFQDTEAANQLLSEYVNPQIEALLSSPDIDLDNTNRDQLRVASQRARDVEQEIYNLHNDAKKALRDYVDTKQLELYDRLDAAVKTTSEGATVNAETYTDPSMFDLDLSSLKRNGVFQLEVDDSKVASLEIVMHSNNGSTSTLIEQFGSIDIDDNGQLELVLLESGVIDADSHHKFQEVVDSVAPMIRAGFKNGDIRSVIFGVDDEIGAIGSHYSPSTHDVFVSLPRGETGTTQEEIALQLVHELAHSLTDSYVYREGINDSEYLQLTAVCAQISSTAYEQMDGQLEYILNEGQLDTLEKYLQPEYKGIADAMRQAVEGVEDNTKLFKYDNSLYSYLDGQDGGMPVICDPVSGERNSLQALVYSVAIQSLSSDEQAQVPWPELDFDSATDEEQEQILQIFDTWTAAREYRAIHNLFEERNFIENGSDSIQYYGHIRDGRSEWVASTTTTMLLFPDKLKDMLNGMGDEDRASADQWVRLVSEMVADRHPDLAPSMMESLDLVTDGRVSITNPTEQQDKTLSEALHAAYEGDEQAAFEALERAGNDVAAAEMAKLIRQILNNKIFR